MADRDLIVTCQVFTQLDDQYNVIWEYHSLLNIKLNPKIPLLINLSLNSCVYAAAIHIVCMMLSALIAKQML